MSNNTVHRIPFPSPLLLDIKSEACNTPLGFIGELLNRQKLVLHAMLKLEENKEIKIGVHIISNNVGCIREPPGAGKSILIVALVLAKKMVSSRPVCTISPISSLYTDLSTYNIKMTFNIK